MALPWLALLGLLLGSMAAGAAAFDAISARFRRLDSSMGLSQDSILAIAQDRHGFIWLGTQDGLNRYDGYEVKAYRATGKKTGGLTTNWVYSLQIDADGVLWVGTNDGLHRFIEREDRFEVFRPRAGDPHSLAGAVVYTLQLDARGRLWVGSDGGLSLWRPDSGDFENWSRETSPALPDNQVRAISHEEDGDLWLATVAGLARFEEASRKILAAPVGAGLGNEPINDVLVDRDGQVWIATDQSGLFRHAPKTGAWVQFQPEGSPALNHRRAHVLLQDAEGAIWVGTEAGVSRIDLQAGSIRIDSFEHLAQHPLGLGRGRVVSLLQDRDGILWFGTWGSGANRLSPRYSRFASFDSGTPATTAMHNPTVLAVMADGDELWLGTGAGLHIFNTRDKRLRPVAGAEALSVFSLADAGDAVWVGTGDGLWRLDRGSGALVRPPMPAELRGARIRRLYAEPGRLWLFAELTGMYVIDTGTGEVLVRQSFPSNLNNIAPLDANTMLISASEGLYWFSREQLALRRHFSVDADTEGGGSVLPSRPSGFVRDAQGRTWIATYGGGVVEMRIGRPDDPDSVRFFPVTRDRGLANEGVNSLMVDHQERLWLATDRGISRLDTGTREIVNFDALDGAFARGYYYSAGARLASGLIAFGSKDGFTLFDPAQAVVDYQPPMPLLVDLERDNQPLLPRALAAGSPLEQVVHLAQRVVLPPGSGRSLGLKFASPDFIAPQRLRYRYQLEGFQDEWLEVDSARRQAGYTNLPPGDYRFRVDAVDPAGRTSAVRELELTIQPWWWQTWWARLAGAVLLVLVALAAHLQRVRHLRRQQAGLKRQVGEHTQALNEARRRAELALSELRSNQEYRQRQEQQAALARLLGGLAAALVPPLGVMRAAVDAGQCAQTGVPETTAALEQAVQQSQHLVDEIAELAAVTPATGEPVELAAFLRERLHAWSVAWQGQPFEWQLECPSGLQLHTDPQRLEAVLRGLVDAAVRRLQAAGGRGHLWLSARRSDVQHLEVRIADDAPGVPPEAVAAHFEPFATPISDQPGLGVFRVRHVAEQALGATLQLRSAVGVGNEYFLRLPLSMAEL